MSNRSSTEPSLHEIQQWMASLIARTARVQRHEASPPLDEWLRLPGGVRPRERLAVHVNGYPARVHESLAESYPAVARIVGEDEFGALTRRYAARVPLASYNLNDAGARLPDELRRDGLLRAWPFLAELAELEWRVTRAFHACERTPLDPQALGWPVADWARAVLHFQPAVATLFSSWPILDLWALRDAPPGPIDVDLRPQPQTVVVRRAGLTVRVESVCADEGSVLRSLLEGQTLAAATAALAADHAGEVLRWFSRWVQEGMIVGATLPEPELAA